MKEEDNDLVLKRVDLKQKRNPETGELETWCEHVMGKKDPNPYSPWKDKEAMELAKQAGWPDDPEWVEKLEALYAQKETSKQGCYQQQEQQALEELKNSIM